jgi:phosphohistidine phosphatase
MEVWILRHAAAERQADWGQDADRALTPKGAKRATSVAKGLSALEPEIEAVLTSPFVRARQTAEPAARALGIERSIETRALEPSRDPEDVVRELSRGKWRSVLLVGHEPHLGSLLGFLVFGDPDREIPLRKAAVAHVSWEPKGEGRLEALLPPEILERLG